MIKKKWETGDWRRCVYVCVCRGVIKAHEQKSEVGEKQKQAGGSEKKAAGCVRRKTNNQSGKKKKKSVET